MRDWLMRFYWRLEKWIVPSLKYSQYHYYDLLKQVVPRDCSWLDLGCGHQMFAAWMTKEEKELAARAVRLTGIDLDAAGLKRNTAVTSKVFGNLEALPFIAASFDIVTANMVIEHIERPEQVLAEVARVLRPGGQFVFHTPNRHCLMMRVAPLIPRTWKLFFIRLLEGRHEEDVFPTFYRMNSYEDIQRLAAAAGLRIARLEAVSTSALLASLGPVAAIELLYLAVLESRRFERMRSNLLVVARKP